MNRAHTVWLDQLGSTDATKLPSAVKLPVFSLEMAGLETPRTKKELFQRLARFIWNSRTKILIIYVIWRFLRKLHSLSQSSQSSSSPLLLGASSIPASFIPSASTGVWLYTRAWRVVPSREIGRIFVLHAYREHIGRYESLAQVWNRAGYSVYGLDHQGHGRSGGEPGYVESFHHYIVDCLEFITLTLAREGANGNINNPSDRLPTFLFGHSMGATIALQIARIQEWRKQAEEEDRETVAGASASPAGSNKPPTISEEYEDVSVPSGSSSSTAVHPSTPSTPASTALACLRSSWTLSGLILSAPALIPDPSATPLLQALASSLADIVPRFGFTPVLGLEQYSSDRAVVNQLLRDPLVYKGNMPARFGHEMLEAMVESRSCLGELTLPVLIQQGQQDRIISPAGAQHLLEHIGSVDKSLKLYDASHDLFLQSNVREQVTQDQLEWLHRQRNKLQTLGSITNFPSSTSASSATGSSSSPTIKPISHQQSSAAAAKNGRRR